MINASADFYQEMANGNRNFILTADIALNSGTVIHLTNADIWQGGFEIEDSVSSDSDFQVGSAIINKLTLTLNNIDGRFTDYEFEYAEVTAKVGLVINGTNRLFNKGIYIVNEATFDDTLITLDCYDRMCKFEQPYSLSNLNYEDGVTLRNIVLNACSLCDVALASNSQSFPNYDLVVNKKPDSDTTTFRQVISWAAQIAGCFARINVNGQLELKRFNVASLVRLNDEVYDGGYFDSSSPYSSGDSLNGGTFNPWNTGGAADGGTFLEYYNSNYPINYIQEVLSHKTSIVPIQFTGVTINVRSEGENPIDPFTVGTSDYALSISDNPFITADNVSTIANGLYTYITALQFWKANVSHLANPLIEAGDVAVFWDRKGNRFPILVTKTTFTSSEAQTTVSAAADPVRKKYQGLTNASKTYVELQRMAFDEKTARQLMYEALTAAINAKQGLYITKEEATGGGSVFYLHDQATLEQSKNVWMITADAFAVTNDYNSEHPEETVWTSGLTVYGDLFTGVLSVVGIDFDWARGGAISISKNGTETFYADVDSGTVRINADSISIGGSSVSDIAENVAESVAKNSTNLLLSPDDLTNWTYWRTDGSGNVAVGGQADPDGGTNAFKITKGTSGTNTVLRVTPENNPLKSAGQNYSFSIWMKASATGSVNIYFNGTSAESTKNVSLTTSWKRYTFEIYASSITSLADYYLCIGGGGSWTPNIIYFYAPVVEYANPFMSQKQTFNQLTNNGADQCIKLQNGQLYINASYINTGYLSANRISGGTLSLGGASDTNGQAKIYDSSARLVGSINKDGIAIYESISRDPHFVKLNSSDGSLVIGQKDSINSNDIEYLSMYYAYATIYPYSVLGYGIFGGKQSSVVLAARNKYGAENGMIVLNPSDSGYNTGGYNILLDGDTLINADLHVNGTIYGTVASSSDERLKTIESWSLSDDFLSEVEPIQFRWNDGRDDKVHFGFGAQSVEKLLSKYGLDDSSIVHYDEEQDKYYLNYIEFIPLLVAENKSLKSKLADMENRLAKLEEILLRKE